MRGMSFELEAVKNTEPSLPYCVLKILKSKLIQMSQRLRSVVSDLMSHVHVSGHKRMSRTLCIPKRSPIQVLTQLNVA